MRLSFCLVPLLFVSGAFAQSAPPKPIAIVHARIEVGDGTFVANGSVVIRGTRIVAVGADVDLPADAEIIDGAGLTLFPGFIDGYSGAGLKIPDAPAAGTPPDSRNTAPATMWHAYRRGIRPDISAAKCLDLGTSFTSNYEKGVTTLVVVPTEGSLPGSAAVVDLADTAVVVAPDVAMGLSIRGGSGAGYPSTLIAMIAVLRQTLADASVYTKKPVDPVFEALQPLLHGVQPAIARANTSRDLIRVDRLADEFKLRTIIYGGAEGWRLASDLKTRGIPVVLSLDLPDEPSLKPETGANPVPAEVLKDRHQIWEEKMANAKKLADAGIEIAFGDRPSNGEMLEPIRQLIKWGLSREAAIKGLAFTPAKIFGVSDRLGSIAVGKIADLIALRGDVTDAKAKVKMVFCEGKRVLTVKDVVK